MDLIAYDHADRSINKIALTFDDGPNPFWTIKILDLFDKYSIKGNFFVLGKRAEEYKDIVKEIFNRGHLIGNHTYSHQKEGVGDFEKAEEIIFNIIGEHTKFIRAPYLSIDLCSKYQPVINGDAKIVSCDVFPKDHIKKSEEIKEIIISSTQNGSIIGLHDGTRKDELLVNRATEMFKVLPEIIEKLKEKFEIVRLDQLNFLNN